MALPRSNVHGCGADRVFDSRVAPQAHQLLYGLNLRRQTQCITLQLSCDTFPTSLPEISTFAVFAQHANTRS